MTLLLADRCTKGGSIIGLQLYLGFYSFFELQYISQNSEKMSQNCRCQDPTHQLASEKSQKPVMIEESTQTQDTTNDQEKDTHKPRFKRERSRSNPLFRLSHKSKKRQLDVKDENSEKVSHVEVTVKHQNKTPS